MKEHKFLTKFGQGCRILTVFLTQLGYVNKEQEAKFPSCSNCNDGGIRMGKSSKSKRFVKQGVDAVTRHSEKIPYHLTYAEAEAEK